MTKEEESQLVSLLSKLSPGFLPYEVFLQVTRLVVTPIIEFVPLRSSGNGIEVLLVERPKNDDIWPGELHAPGTVIRATDNEGEIYKAFERILVDELDGAKVSEPYYVGSILHPSKRGMEQAQVFWVEVLEEPKIGTFYDVNNLPPEFMHSQEIFVKQAATSFSAVKA